MKRVKIKTAIERKTRRGEEQDSEADTDRADRDERYHSEKNNEGKKRAGENPRKLIMQHLLPTQSAYAPSLHLLLVLLFLLSSFRILLHPFLPPFPFSAASSSSSLCRAPPPSSHLSGDGAELSAA